MEFSIGAELLWVFAVAKLKLQGIKGLRHKAKGSVPFGFTPTSQVRGRIF